MSGQACFSPGVLLSGRQRRRLVLCLAVFAASLLLGGSPSPGAIETGPLQSVAPEFIAPPAGGKLPSEIEELQQAAEHFQKQEYQRSWDLLVAARKKYSYLPPPRLMLARFFLVHDLLPPARVAMEQAAAEEPEYPGVYLTLAELALAERRVTDALVHFEKAGQLVQTGKWPDNQRIGFSVQVQSGLASVAEARQDWRSAARYLAAWLEMQPGSGRARYRLARALFAQGDLAAARTHLEKAAKDDPLLEPAPVAMAWFHTHQGSAQKARDLIQRAAADAPNDARTRIAAATWFLYHREPDGAKPHAAAAERLDPKSKQASLIVAAVARHLRDYTAAESRLEALHRAEPGDLDVANQLALVLAEQADEAKRRRALDLAEATAKSHPGSAEAMATLGWVCYRLGRLADAEQALRAARAGASTRPDTAYYLARVLAERGQRAEAGKLLKQALDAPGTFVFYSDAKRLLEDWGKPTPP